MKVTINFKIAPAGTTHCYAPRDLVWNREPLHSWQWSRIDRRGNCYYYDASNESWEKTIFRSPPHMISNPDEVVKVTPSFLIIGHGRHGKTEATNYLIEKHGFKAAGSSEICADLLKPLLDVINGEKPAIEHFNERHELTDVIPTGRGNSEIWNRAISLINAVDKSSLAKHILSKNDIYTGMRCFREYEASKHLFNVILYIDAAPRVDYVDPTFNIKFDKTCMRKIINNGVKEDMFKQLDNVIWHLQRGSYRAGA